MTDNMYQDGIKTVWDSSTIKPCAKKWHFIILGNLRQNFPVPLKDYIEVPYLSKRLLIISCFRFFLRAEKEKTQNLIILADLAFIYHQEALILCLLFLR